MAQYFTSSLYQFDDTLDGYLRQPSPISVPGVQNMSAYWHGNFANSKSGYGKCLTEGAGWEFGTYKFYSQAQIEALIAMGNVTPSLLGGNFIISWQAYMPSEGLDSPSPVIVGNAYVNGTPPQSNEILTIPGIEVFRYGTRAGFFIKVFVGKKFSNLQDHLQNNAPLEYVNDYTTVSLISIFPDGTYQLSQIDVYGLAQNWHNFQLVKNGHEVKFYTDDYASPCTIDVANAFTIDAYGGTAWFRSMDLPAYSAGMSENHISFYSAIAGYCIDEVRFLICGFEIYNTITITTTPGSPKITGISPTDIAKISVGDIIEPSAQFPNGATVLEVGADYIIVSQPAATSLEGGGGKVRSGGAVSVNPAKPPYTAEEIQRIGQITVGDAKISELKKDPTTAGYDSFISSLALMNDNGAGRVFIKSGNSNTDWTELVQEGAITLSAISQSGATTGQVASWNGTAWVATTSSTGASTSLSNVINTSVSDNLIPESDSQKNLGSALKRWLSLFATKIVDSADKVVVNITSRLLVNSSGTPVLDFSSTDINVLNSKVTNLANGTANTDAVNLSQLKDPTNITQDATHRFVTDTQITTWNGVSSNEPAITAGTTSDYWRGDKTWQTLNKAAVGLSNVANVDTTIASNITEDSTHRFVTDTDKSNWNAAKIADISISASDVDWTLGTTFYKSVNADTTFTFSNTAAGKIITVVVFNSSVSSYINITFPAGIVSTGTAINGYIQPGGSRAFIFEKSNGTIFCQGPSFPYQVNLSTFSGSTIWPLVKSYFGSQNADSSATMTIPCVGSKNGDITMVAVANNGASATLTVSFTASDATAVTFFAGNAAADGTVSPGKTALFTLHRINNNIRIRKDTIV